MIQRHEGRHAVALMCRVLTVSRCGYYDRHGRPPPDRGQANVRLAAYVQRVYAEHKGHAGASPSGCALWQRASTWRRQIRTTICQSRRTCWRRSSRRQGRTTNGRAASPTSRLKKAGCMWRWCWPCTRGRLIGWAMSERTAQLMCAAHGAVAT